MVLVGSGINGRTGGVIGMSSVDGMGGRDECKRSGE